MTKYKICFACTLPGEPGCGCPDNDFYAEHGFEGSAEEAVQKAESLSWENYSGDFRWWIVDDQDIETELEEPAEKKTAAELHHKFYTPPSMDEVLKKSNNVADHSSLADLALILGEPTYTEIAIFPPGVRNSIEFAYRHWEFHCIYFDLYNNGLLVERGKQQPGSSGFLKPPNTTSSVLSVEEMVYRHNLACGKEISHVLRGDYFTSFHTREFVERNPLKIDVYDFLVDDKLVHKYELEHRNFLEKKEERLGNICGKLKIKGTTL